MPVRIKFGESYNQMSAFISKRAVERIVRFPDKEIRFPSGQASADEVWRSKDVLDGVGEHYFGVVITADLGDDVMVLAGFKLRLDACTGMADMSPLELIKCMAEVCSPPMTVNGIQQRFIDHAEVATNTRNAIELMDKLGIDRATENPSLMMGSVFTRPQARGYVNTLRNLFCVDRLAYLRWYNQMSR